MLLAGAAGTGKSTVIAAISALFTLLNKSYNMTVCAYTGVAANNVDGMTLHTALCLSNGVPKENSSARRDLIAMWSCVDYLIIDEFSMIGCRLLTQISEALCIAKETSEPFGNINIIFAGDFMQLPPIGDRALYQRLQPNSEGTTQGQTKIFGKLLWYTIDVAVTLTETMHQRGNDANAFVDLLHRVRTGSTTIEDYAALNSRVLCEVDVLDRPDGFTTPILVNTNSTKDEINTHATESFAEKTGRELHWYHSVDVVHKTVIGPGALKDRLNMVSGSSTQYKLGKMALVIGMPMMLVQNFDIAAGVVNGVIGTLQSLKYSLDDDQQRILKSVIIRTEDMKGDPIPGLQPQEFQVLQERSQATVKSFYGGQDLHFTRSQVAIVPAFAMTVHKAQSRTLDRVIVDLKNTRTTAEAYVMLSRVRTFDQLFILRRFDWNNLKRSPPRDVRAEYHRQAQLPKHSTLSHAHAPSPAPEESTTDLHIPGYIPGPDRTTDIYQPFAQRVLNIQETNHPGPQEGPSEQRPARRKVKLTTLEQYPILPPSPSQLSNSHVKRPPDSHTDDDQPAPKRRKIKLSQN
ncbi:hypothetical protein D9611_012159 [Ephemerocybe angulata]|uniref:ATP-dependent DNA helicase n=1 Tax=Ephemerocybe angulata TaxID=980116 RepID=A0A8H5C5F5_9AGAR|nr:hypothetical protein D9611_012159 [Tulosesus angulatus]